LSASSFEPRSWWRPSDQPYSPSICRSPFAAILAALGFALLPALPVLLTAAERLAGLEAAGTSGSIIWLAGNLGAIVVSLVVQVLVNDPVAAFLVMAAVALLALPAPRRFSVATVDPAALVEAPA
jgi:hypothetical protein